MASAVASTSSNRLPGHRYKINSHVTNPAYVTEISQSDTRCSPQDALKHMQSLDLCDITVINPLFHSGIPFSDPEINRFCSVDMVVKNQFFGMGVPRYEKIQPPRENSLFSQSWVDEYPLHSAALEGDIPRIKQLLRDGYNPHTLDKDSWAPIHCACWYGKAEAVKVLLQQGRCSPTIANGTGSTPLHFAAMKGYARVVKILLAHQEIDKSAVDKDNKTPLQLCEESQENEWEQVSAMLREALKKPAPKIDVHLMDLDSSHVVLDLVSGNNTTVEQLLRQLGKLPVGCEHLFAIWIASQNLHLQLRPTHKPIMEVRDWEFTIRQFTNYKPERERPYLYLRRNALLSLRAERQIKDSEANKMLFDECVLNVLRSMYPTSDQDAINLAAILMQIIYGDHDPKKHRSGFLNNINLRHFIPTMKLVGRSQSGKTINWAQKIVQEHKNVTAKGIKETSKLQVMYLEYCRTRFPAYGSAFFFGFAPPPSGARNPIGVYIGVNSQGIHLIKADSKTMIYSARYDGLQWECTLDKGQFKLYRKEKLTPFIEIKTKQAAIICNLMGKLSGQIPHPMSKQQQPQQTHQQFPPRRSSSSNSKR
ncbi:krev interaction trapped protein 1-like isoform X2 [Ptychodera flava]|uniref:krev interaction trapped protein 1-like isoform X2 n=1 Tax=Ptychodera flava TaxID=63121 RepID=UPI00396AAED7